MFVRKTNATRAAILFIFLVKRTSIRSRTAVYVFNCARIEVNVDDALWMYLGIPYRCICVAYDSRWSCEEILRSNGRRR